MTKTTTTPEDLNAAVQSMNESMHKWELQKAYQQGRMDSDLAAITSMLTSVSARLNTWTEESPTA